MSLEQRMQSISVEGVGESSKVVVRGSTQASTEWRQFPANVQRQDANLHRGRASQTAQNGSTSNVRDTYQQTTVVNGRRSNLGPRNVRAIKASKSYRQPPRAKAASFTISDTATLQNNTTQVPATQQLNTVLSSAPVPDLLGDLDGVAFSQSVMVNRVAGEAPFVVGQAAPEGEELLIEL